MNSGPSASDAALFRRFNRMYTRFLGALDEGLLHSEYSLPEARILYELANRPLPRAGEIAADLDIDPGYLSRVLKKFAEHGLLRRKTAKHDARSAEIALTPRGRAAFEKLNALSENQARSVLDGLAPSARGRLLESMQSIESILSPTGGERAPFILRPHRIGDMGWIVHREGIGYAEQFGWDVTFEALVARIVDGFLTHYDPDRERCWVAEVDGKNAGHIFLVRHEKEPDTARLRLLFVEPFARGKGLGDALVSECVRFARTAGYRRVVLWTQSILTAAHKIYQRAGFQLVKEEPHHSFGHDLIGQEWALDLFPADEAPKAAAAQRKKRGPRRGGAHS